MRSTSWRLTISRSAEVSAGTSNSPVIRTAIGMKWSVLPARNWSRNHSRFWLSDSGSGSSRLMTGIRPTGSPVTAEPSAMTASLIRSASTEANSARTG